MNTPASPSGKSARTICAQVAQTIALLEASRADSATQRDRSADACRHFFSGRVQAFDLALAELRDLVEEVAA